ncbi:hypothetical protein MK280_19685, partial [Myxococcota bacterium]|nr:hypothetical protein [Myxococcota bacterium]
MEIDRSIRIVHWGSSGDGPASFIVQRKNGVTEYYGTSEDSRIEAAGRPAVRTWALTTVFDKNGNYINYSYLENNSEGEFVPSHIEYTGHHGQNLAPDTRVTFVYEDSPRILRSYQAGTPISLSLRLKGLQVHAPGDNSGLVSEYRFAYTESAGTGRSLLSSVSFCDGDGECLPATEFTYGQAGYGTFPLTSVPLPESDSNLAVGFLSLAHNLDWELEILFAGFPIDFPDWLSHESEAGRELEGALAGKARPNLSVPSDYIVLPSGESVIPNWPYGGCGEGILDCGSPVWRTAFINEDDIPDLLRFKGNRVDTVLNRGDGSFEIIQQQFPPVIMPAYTDDAVPQFTSVEFSIANMARCASVGDIDGDGLDDLAFVPCHFLSKPQFRIPIRILLSNGDGTYRTRHQFLPEEAIRVNSEGDSVGPSFLALADATRDGIPELLINFSTAIQIHKQEDEVDDLVIEIRSGLGEILTVDYAPGSRYDDDPPPLSGCGFQMIRDSGYAALGRQYEPACGPRTVVAAVHQTDSLAGDYTISFDYDGRIKFDTESGLDIPFERIWHRDSRNERESYTEYSQEGGGYSRVLATGQTYASLSGVEPGDERLLAWDECEASGPAQVQTAGLNGTVTKTVLAWDEFCNPTSMVRRSDNGEGLVYVEHTETEYWNDTDRWLIGKPTSIITTFTREGACTDSLSGPVALPEVTREVRFAYDPETGQVIERRHVSHAVDPIRIPATEDRITTYEYDARGNLIKEVRPGETSRQSRTTEFQYGGYGNGARARFLQQAINAEGHVAHSRFDARWGVPIETTDRNGRLTTFSYDSLGRLESTLRPDGTSSTATQAWCDAGSGCPAGAVMFSSTTRDGAPTQTAYSDALGRVLRTTVDGFSGPVHTDMLYDNLGRLVSKSQPHYAGETKLYDTFLYDARGRILVHTRPDQSRYTYEYAPGMRGVTDPENIYRYEEYDSEGRTIRVEQGNGASTTEYTYGADGNLWVLTDATGQSTYRFFNSFGEKVIHWDADRGHARSVYDRFGDLIQEVSEGQSTGFEYDRLGRLVRRQSAEGTAQ